MGKEQFPPSWLTTETLHLLDPASIPRGFKMIAGLSPHLKRALHQMKRRFDNVGSASRSRKRKLEAMHEKDETIASQLRVISVLRAQNAYLRTQMAEELRGENLRLSGEIKQLTAIYDCSEWVVLSAEHVFK
jgi:hypothetical protein